MGSSTAVSNLGVLHRHAVGGPILVAGITATPERSYALMVGSACPQWGVIGLVAAIRLPRDVEPATVSPHIPAGWELA